MKFAPCRVKQAELSDKEKIVLRGIAEGKFIAVSLCQRLQKLGLVEKRLDVWAVTAQGHIYLMFQNAR